MIVLDTNVISELVKPRPSAAVAEWFGRQAPERLFLTSITLGEIDLGARAHQQPHRRDALLAWCDELESVMFMGRILPFDAPCARVWSRMVEEAQARGRPMEWRDSQIAATVLHAGARLATRNRQHFAGLGIDVIDPFGGAA